VGMTPRNRLIVIGNNLKAHFLVGILVAVPLGATIIILLWAFNTVDGILGPIVTWITKRDIPGVGLAGTLLLIYLAGVIGTTLAGRRILVFSEGVLDRMPLVRSIYGMVKQILEGFSSPKSTGFMQVVMIEYPREGVMSLAFVTNKFKDRSGTEMYNLFVPTSPNPTSGYLRIMKASDVTPTSLTADEAIKMLVSFGRVAPEAAGEKLGESPSDPLE
jgi:uncharacterized membrane protein